jgi:biopolymer transport protein ExbB
MLWITVIEWLSRLVLVILIGLSFWSVSIIIERRRFFKNIPSDANDLKKSIRERNFSLSGYYGEFLKELQTLKSSEKVDQAFEAIVSDKKKELEKGLPVLGTLGSTSPFIGLLGTILGIIVSFGELSRGAGSTNTVMFSLAEALILTAVGLVVAIPAVVAFNFYNRKARLILAEARTLKDLLLAYRE